MVGSRSGGLYSGHGRKTSQEVMGNKVMRRRRGEVL